MTQAERIQARLDALAECTDEPGRITRLFLSPAHRRAVLLVRGWMQAAGLDTALDSTATLIGRRAGPAPDSPTLLLGSHIDSVHDAGRYDGCLGVVAAIEAVAAGPLPYAVEIRAFGDEEGVRFPITLTGSHAAAGRFDPAWRAVRDGGGVTLADALLAFGAGEACPSDAFAYLELHIEQGPVLEDTGAALGVVTAINGASRFSVTVCGRAGHAGTTPMDRRQDALAAAAGMVLAVRDAARARPGAVATVGRLEARPGAVNVIPGEAGFTIDLRAPDDRVRHEAAAAIRRRLRDIAASEHVRLDIVRTHDAPAVACDPRLRALLAAAIGEPAVALPSGAGHDAMAIAALCPIGMLFVRCAGGVSHHPGEAVTTADIAAALDALLAALRSIDPAEFRQ